MLQSMTPDPADPVDPLDPPDPLSVPNWCFASAKRYFLRKSHVLLKRNATF